MLEQAFGLLIDEIALDIGSEWLRVFVKGRGLVVEEPSIVSVSKRRGKDAIVEMGREAKQMMGRTPEGIETIYPIQNAKITHPNLAVKMITKGLEKAIGGKSLLRPRILVSKPHGLKGNDLQIFRDVIRTVGGRDTNMIDSLICAALGCDLPIDIAKGIMVIDIGSGGTRIGVMSLSTITNSNAVAVSGSTFDAAIIKWLKENKQVLIGPKTAEEIKKSLGSAFEPDPERHAQFRARDVHRGLARDVNITSVDIHKALKAPMNKLLTSLQATCRELSPELAADLVQGGIILCGGGCLLGGISDYLQSQIQLPVIEVDNPKHAVINGIGSLLDGSLYTHWVSS